MTMGRSAPRSRRTSATRAGGAVRATATNAGAATIRSGSASMDESMITGESRPVRRDEGDAVVAGTVATDSGLRVEITAVGDDTALAGIQRLVTTAQNSSSRAQRIADRAAAWLFWFALIAGVITAIVWTVIGLPDQAVVRTITVLVIACPHALGLAIPLVVAIATRPAIDADLWWHLRSGQWMADHHAIIRADPFSHTRRGVEREPTDWLSEVGLYGLWAAVRLPGIALVVAALATGGVGWDSYRLLHDPAIRALLPLVRCEHDAAVEAEFPANMSGRLTVETEAGTVSRMVVVPKGEPSNFMTGAELRAKFDGLAVPVMGEHRATGLADAVLAMDGLADVSALTRLASPMGSARLAGD